MENKEFEMEESEELEVSMQGCGASAVTYGVAESC